MISWEEIENHLPDEYDEERHEILRHEIKWYEHEIRDLEDEIEDLEEQLEPYKSDMETLEAQINDIQNIMNDEIKKIETEYDELIKEKLEQIEKLKIEIDELSKCRDNETHKIKLTHQEKIDKLNNQYNKDKWGKIVDEINDRLSKKEDLQSEMEPVLEEFFKYEKMVNLVELELMYGWKKGNVIRRYDLEFGLNGPRVVGLTHGIIVGPNEDGTKYLWTRLKKSNGELFKKVEEFEGTKYEKVADSYEEYMEKFGYLYR